MISRGHNIVCSNCVSGWHLGCAFKTRGQIEGVRREVWKCDVCFKSERCTAGARVDGMYARSGLSEETDGGTLRVVQWNVDHLMAKVPELEVWLRERSIDVALLQETKLRTEDGVLKVRGFEVIRKDRNRGANGRGGGLVCLVREDWKYREVECGVPGDGGVEVLGVDVFDDKKRVWHFVNVYVPPVNSRVVELSGIEGMCDMSEGSWFVGGDWNAHNICWDPFVEGDERGEMVMEWLDERGLVVLNDGTASRKERGSGRPSVPDVTAVSGGMRNECRWEVVEGFTSDHFPIVVTVGEGGVRPSREVKRLMWNWSEANWEGYKEWLERKAGVQEWSSMSVTEMERKVCSLILTAARMFVGRKKVNVGGPVGMKAEARAAAREREIGYGARVQIGN